MAQGSEGSGTLWRIRDAGTFTALSRSRTRARSGPLTIVWAPGPPGAPPAAAFAIGRRVGTAVVRNRLRRRLRARLASADTPPGAYLVICRPDAADLPFSALDEHVTTALTALERSRRADAAR